MSSIDFRKTKTDGVIHDGSRGVTRHVKPWTGGWGQLISCFPKLAGCFSGGGVDDDLFSGRDSRIGALHGTCWLGWRIIFRRMKQTRNPKSKFIMSWSS